MFQFSLFCECTDLEYVRIQVKHSVKQVEYAIRFPVAALQEYADRSAISNRAPHALFPSGAAWVNP